MVEVGTSVNIDVSLQYTFISLLAQNMIKLWRFFYMRKERKLDIGFFCTASYTTLKRHKLKYSKVRL